MTTEAKEFWTKAIIGAQVAIILLNLAALACVVWVTR
jgi:hypothetical protein